MNLLQVIEKVATKIQENNLVHAMWLEGSWATGKNKEHSDIDVWMDIVDGTFDECIVIFRNALLEIGTIDQEDSKGMYARLPNLVKHTFHLSGFPQEQTIELDMQEHSRDISFEEGTDIIKVLFDKDGTIKWSPRKFWDMAKQSPIVEHALEFVKSGKALDLGSAGGVNSFYLAEKGFDTTAVDNNIDALSELEKRNKSSDKKVNIINSDIVEFFSTNKYDIVVCTMVLHFLEEKRVKEVVRKMQLMTRQGGVNVITVYTDKNEPGKRPYLFHEGELRSLYDDWEIVYYDEAPTRWFQMPSEDQPRRNHAAYLIAVRLDLTE